MLGISGKEYFESLLCAGEDGQQQIYKLLTSHVPVPSERPLYMDWESLSPDQRCTFSTASKSARINPPRTSQDYFYHLASNCYDRINYVTTLSLSMAKHGKISPENNRELVFPKPKYGVQELQNANGDVWESDLDGALLS